MFATSRIQGAWFIHKSLSLLHVGVAQNAWMSFMNRLYVHHTPLQQLLFWAKATGADGAAGEYRPAAAVSTSTEGGYPSVLWGVELLVAMH